MSGPIQEPFEERRREPRGKGTPHKPVERDRQVALGGADAVPDTPQIAAHGADLDPRPEASPDARVDSGGTNVWLWGGLILLAVVAAIYAIGLF